MSMPMAITMKAAQLRSFGAYWRAGAGGGQKHGPIVRCDDAVQSEGCNGEGLEICVCMEIHPVLGDLAPQAHAKN